MEEAEPRRNYKRINTIVFKTAIYFMQFDLEKRSALTRLFAMSFRCSSIISCIKALQLCGGETS